MNDEFTSLSDSADKRSKRLVRWHNFQISAHFGALLMEQNTYFWGGNINLIINLMYSNSVHESASGIKPIKTPMTRSTFTFCSQLQSHSQSQRIENRIDSSFKLECFPQWHSLDTRQVRTENGIFIYIYKCIYIRLETKSCRILPLTYATKYDMTQFPVLSLNNLVGN